MTGPQEMEASCLGGGDWPGGLQGSEVKQEIYFYNYNSVGMTMNISDVGAVLRSNAECYWLVEHKTLH